MAVYQSRLLETSLAGKLVAGKIQRPSNLPLAPGQYLLARAEGSPDPLPAPLFATGFTNGEILLAPPLPPAWSAGMMLHLRGPLGQGFHLPKEARHIALASLDVHPYRLLGLLEPALKQGAEVTLYLQGEVSSLPPAVEVLPIEFLKEVPAWADYLAMDVPIARLTELRSLLGIQVGSRLGCAGEALVLTPMPCGGLADCGVCAVSTRDGWKLACKDGPVFDMSRLEGI